MLDNRERRVTDKTGVENHRGWSCALALMLVVFAAPVLRGVSSAAASGPLELISVSSAGVHKPQSSMSPVISRNGRYVAFVSFADFDTAVNPNSIYPSLYLRDRVASSTKLLSRNYLGDPAVGSMFGGAVTDDGRYVLIGSNANLVAPHDGRFHVYVRDTLSGGLSRVDVSETGVLANDGSYVSEFGGAMSPDGRFVVFSSWASNLVPGDTNGMPDIFLRDTVAGTTRLVSLNSSGQQANYTSSTGSVSDDGRFVAFDSPANNLVPNDTNQTCPGPCGNGSGGDVFIRDMTAGTTERVSVSSVGTQSNDSGGRQSYAATISGNGRYVSFFSGATNLVPGDTNDSFDGFLHDRANSTTTRVSVAPDGSQLPHGSRTVTITHDARYALMLMNDAAAAPGFPAGSHQAVRRDLVSGRNDVASTDAHGTPLPAGVPGPGRLSGDGSELVFATNQALLPTDNGSNEDIYAVKVPAAAPPVVSVSGVTNGASYEFGAVPAAVCTAVDPIDGAAAAFAATLSVPTGPRAASGLGMVTAACSYTNSRGITASASVSYSAIDTVGPALSIPDGIRVEATARLTPVAFTVAAVDLVDGTRTVSCDPMSGSGFAVGSTTVTCTSADVAGNATAATFTVTVSDTTNPVLVLPASVTVAAGTAATWPAPTATDAVDGAVPVVCDHASGTTFALGTTVVTCTANDAAGNTASGSFTVQVQDQGPPAVTVPAAVTIEATGPNGAVASFNGVSATDDVDGSVAVTCDRHSGQVFALGTTVVTCSARDTAGNSGSATFTVTVVDTTAPAISVPPNQIAEATGPLGATVTFAAPTAHDVVDGESTPHCSAEPGSQFGLGDTLVSCAATDATGNAGSATFVVTVTDTSGPVVTAPPAVVAEATAPAGALVNYGMAAAMDVVDGPVAVSCDPASGGTFALGVTTVACHAVDSHGNAGSATSTVTVRDTTSPVLHVPANQVANATGSAGASVTFPAATALDLVTTTITPSCDHAPGATFPIGTTTITCRATDQAGNSAEAAFTVKVVDADSPIVVVPATINAEATGSHGATVVYSTPTATDAVDGALAVTCDHGSGTTFAIGVTVVTCTATDSAGNNGINTFAVHVVDTTPPAIVTAANQSVIATSADGATGSYPAATAVDVVDGTLTASCTPASGARFPLGVTAVTCTATDAAGNAGNSSFHVTVTYNWSGPQAPLTDGATYKVGRTIPIKFTLTGASAGVSTATARLWLAEVSGTTPSQEVEATPTGAATSGNSFRYDPASGVYSFNLNTKLLEPGTWRLRIDLGDGVLRTTTVILTR